MNGTRTSLLPGYRPGRHQTVPVEPGSIPRNGLPEFRPYVYRGTGKDTLTAWMDEPSPPTHAPQCGSYGGYQRHKRLREHSCDPCLDAMRRDRQERQNGSGSKFNTRRRERRRHRSAA